MTSEPTLRIVDFSTHLSGPMASHLLSELGADVIKVENPRTGDGNRGDLRRRRGDGDDAPGAEQRRPQPGGRSALGAVAGADRRLRPMGGRGSRRGAAGRCPPSRHGLRDDEGPQPGADLLLASRGSASTARGVTSPPMGRRSTATPARCRSSTGTIQPETQPGWRTAGTTLGGVFAALGILAAVHRRDQRAGNCAVPRRVPLACGDVVELARPDDARQHRRAWLDYSDLGSRYSLYRTARTGMPRWWRRPRSASGSRSSICVGLPAEWKGLRRLVGQRMDHGAGEAYAHERPVIAERIASRSLEDWTAIFAEAEIPFAPILSLEEAMNSEHARVNGVMRQTTTAGRTDLLAARLADPHRRQRPRSPRRPGPIGPAAGDRRRHRGVARRARAGAARLSGTVASAGASFEGSTRVADGGQRPAAIAPRAGPPTRGGPRRVRRRSAGCGRERSARRG